jgi:hypothetical protein
MVIAATLSFKTQMSVCLYQGLNNTAEYMRQGLWQCYCSVQETLAIPLKDSNRKINKEAAHFVKAFLINWQRFHAILLLLLLFSSNRPNVSNFFG